MKNRSSLTATDRVAGQKLGSIDLATKEIELGGGRDLIMLDSITDEIMSKFREIMERRAIEKGAKKIKCTGITTRCEYRI